MYLRILEIILLLWSVANSGPDSKVLYRWLILEQVRWRMRRIRERKVRYKVLVVLHLRQTKNDELLIIMQESKEEKKNTLLPLPGSCSSPRRKESEAILFFSKSKYGKRVVK